MSPLSLSLLLLLLSLLTPTLSSSDLTSHLISLRSKSPSSVIRLDDALLNRILSTPSRRFTFVVFFDAVNLHSKSDLRLKPLFNEFSLLSHSFLTNNPSESLFFFVTEFSQSQASFARFGVNSLPHIRLVPETAMSADLDSNTVKMDAADYSRLAESMGEFVERHTNFVVGEIRRPPVISKAQFAAIASLFLISSPFLVKRLLLGDTLLHNKKMWLFGAVFVYFFSVSGGMFNIIRKMPMFMGDREDPDKVVFFYQGSGMQLGAEGFSVGGLYSVVGLLLAFVTHVLVKVRNVNVQRGVMVFALFVSFWAVKKVVFLDNWKTGYGIHMYWPSGWQ